MERTSAKCEKYFLEFTIQQKKKKNDEDCSRNKKKNANKTWSVSRSTHRIMTPSKSMMVQRKIPRHNKSNASDQFVPKREKQEA